jgi:hypothetical protein
MFDSCNNTQPEGRLVKLRYSLLDTLSFLIEFKHMIILINDT